MMKRLSKSIITILIVVPFYLNIEAQVRQNIYSFSTLDQDTLAGLILDYLSDEVISTHSATMWPSSGLPNNQRVHGNENFLPFHREYIAGLEDYLVLRGYPQFVPLPKWAPEDSISTPFQQISPHCDSAYPGAGGTLNCAPLNNTSADTARAMTSFAPWQSDPNLCNYSYIDIVGNGIPPATVTLSYLENPWHNSVHGMVGGVMGWGKSPGAVIFLPWHAYVDDVWKEWECSCDSAPAVDLWMRDTPMRLASTPSAMHTMSMDRGIEPNAQSVPNFMWLSEDIWVRNQNDGFTTDEHQNPEYSPTVPNYVYVRIRNKGCQASLGSEKLVLHWAKAATSLTWPSAWNGTTTIGASGPSAGDTIDEQLIDTIKAGGSIILEFPWYPPDPANYSGINPQPWHFCLLARIVAGNDPMASAEISDVNANVQNNNNIAWKNLTVVDSLPGIVGAEILPGGVIGMGNYEQAETFDFELISLDFDEGVVYEEAEVRLTLDEDTWQKWNNGGQQAENIEIYNEENKQLIVTGNNAWLKNLSFDAEEYSTMYVSFNFLIDEITEHPEFDYHVVQRRASDQKIIGGEKYHILKPDPNREDFMAMAGGDKYISKHDSASLSATHIGEPAIYNWYGSDGKLLHTGQDLKVSPLVTEKYKLEVIAKSDAFKDYDKVMVYVKQYDITGISPNPASTTVTVSYDIESASAAYMQLMRPYSNSTNNYTLDLTKDEISINVSGYTAGLYNVILYVDGQAVDVKNLSIQ